jgi:hypothetical protein
MYEPVTKMVKAGYDMDDRGYILAMGRAFFLLGLTQKFGSNSNIFYLYSEEVSFEPRSRH